MKGVWDVLDIGARVMHHSDMTYFPPTATLTTAGALRKDDIIIDFDHYFIRLARLTSDPRPDLDGVAYETDVTVLYSNGTHDQFRMIDGCHETTPRLMVRP